MTELGSILLASTNPEALRTWYEKAFGIAAGENGFLRFGAVGLLIDGRDDVAEAAAEPARVILNYHVDDAKAVTDHLDGLGVTWVSPLEYREGPKAWFATLRDPDGNYIQVIQLPPGYTPS